MSKDQLAKLNEKLDKAIIQGEIFNIKKKISKIESSKGVPCDRGLRGEKGDKGDRGVKGIDGKDGKDGKNGIKGEKGENGLDGKNGQDGKDGEDGKDGSPDSPLQIKYKLESLTDGERLDASAIKNLPDGSSGTRRGRAWGTITGVLANQTDLQAALDAKFTLPSLTSGSVLFSNGTTIAEDNTNFSWNDSSNKLSVANVLISGLTASELIATDASKNLVSLAVATYPSLTELTYLKGVTSAIQTQLDAKIDGSGSATRVAFFSDSNTLTSDADMTFATDTLTVTKVVGSTHLSTPLIITASGALGITPAAGSNLNVTLSTTGDFAVNTNHLYVDTSAGSVGIGTTSPVNLLTVVGTTDGQGVTVDNYSDSHTTVEGRYLLRRARGTAASPTDAFAGTLLGRIEWQAYNGSAWVQAAYIQPTTIASGVTATKSAPLSFYTSASDGSAMVKSMTLAGGSASFVDTPTATFGDGSGFAGTINISLLASKNAAIALGNVDISTKWSMGMLGSNGAFKIVPSQFITNTAYMIMSTTGEVQFGGITDNIFHTGKLSSIVAASTKAFTAGTSQATPDGTVLMDVGTNYGTVQEISFNDYGGAVFNEQGRADADFRIETNDKTHAFFVDGGTELVGINTSAPDKQLEINSADGNNLRLTYNDSNGSAANYADFLMSSGGDLTITPSGGDTSVTGTLAATTYFLRSVGNGLTAAGSTRADALQLAKEINNVTTAAAGTGVILPVGVIGMRIVIFNAGANAIQVYASASETIDGTAGATGVPLTNAKRCEYFFVAANTWISAQLGVISA